MAIYDKAAINYNEGYQAQKKRIQVMNENADNPAVITRMATEMQLETAFLQALKTSMDTVKSMDQQIQQLVAG